jgi:tetratricopeptide (TPR) repeat protein
MSYDVGRHGLSQRYLIQALNLAKASGDRPLGAEILAAMSHQATYLGDGAEAVHLARAAGRTASQVGVQGLVAEAAVMEAHGHASRGDEAACATALSQAEAALDRADRAGEPQWMTYFDEAYLAAKFGHCFRELRQPAQAERFARRSLDMDNNYVRGRAFNLALLAHAYAQQGEVKQACAVGFKAIDLAAGLNSVRAVRYLSDLRRELAPYRTAPAVVRLDERLQPLLGAVA